MKDAITDEFYWGLWDYVVAGGAVLAAAVTIYVIVYLVTLS